jgi:hypothetical protein
MDKLFALAKNFGIIHNEPERIINYANGIKHRSSKEKSINCVILYGSLSKRRDKNNI